MKTKSIPALVNVADKAFSQFIRHRDSVTWVQNEEGFSIPAGYCVTCSKLTPTKGVKTGHCGHFIPRGCKLTRFDEQNAALQCNYCNTYRFGEQYKFGRAIDQRWGQGTAERLQKLEQTYKREGYKWQRDELEALILYYREKVKS